MSDVAGNVLHEPVPDMGPVERNVGDDELVGLPDIETGYLPEFSPSGHPIPPELGRGIGEKAISPLLQRESSVLATPNIPGIVVSHGDGDRDVPSSPDRRRSRGPSKPAPEHTDDGTPIRPPRRQRRRPPERIDPQITEDDPEAAISTQHSLEAPSLSRRKGPVTPPERRTPTQRPAVVPRPGRRSAPADRPGRTSRPRQRPNKTAEHVFSIS